MASNTVTLSTPPSPRAILVRAGAATALAVVSALALTATGALHPVAGAAYASEAVVESTDPAAVPTVEAPEAGFVTVEAPATFSNAEVVELALTDGTCSLRAVVADRAITFYAPQAGTYTVTRTYEDVWSVVDALPARSYFAQTTGRDVLAVQLTDDGLSLTVDGALAQPQTSSADQPIVALAHFVGVGAAPSGSVEMDRKTADALLGYTTGSENALAAAARAAQPDGSADADRQPASDFPPTYLLIEDRDENTGSLLASLLFAPDADGAPCAAGEGGSQAFNLVVNPASDLLEERFATHSLVAGDDAAAQAAGAVAALEQPGSVAVLANLDTMASYSTGAKRYTLNLDALLDGAFAPGTELRLVYLGAAGDANAYVGSLSAAFEDKLLATDAALAVDERGFVSFDLYGGGIYLLGLPDAVDGALTAGCAALADTLSAAPADTPDATGDAETPDGALGPADAVPGNPADTSDAFSLGAAADASIDTRAVQPAPAAPNTVIANTVAGPGWKAWAIPAAIVVLADIVVLTLMRRVRCRRCRRDHEARIAALTRALSIEQASSGETAEQRVLRTSGAARFAAGNPAPADQPVRTTLDRVARTASDGDAR